MEEQSAGQQPDPVPSVDTEGASAPPTAPKEKRGVGRGQITALIVLTVLMLFSVIGAAGLAVFWVTAPPKYEYRTLEFKTSAFDKTGSGAVDAATVTPGQAELNELGIGGWEVVGTYLEMETAWPNFGDSQYVTGLQPNVRPQRLVVILKRRMQ